MQAIILDTETNNLHGLPVQIAYLPCAITVGGELVTFDELVFDQLYSVDAPICHAAMAVHHILESDLVGMPSHKTFTLPSEYSYIVGHNIDYDLEALKKCGVDTVKYLPICTLAIARKLYPHATSHSMSALSYMLSDNPEETRNQLRNAHNAKADILLTAQVLRKMIKTLGVTSLQALYEYSVEASTPTFIHFGKYKGTALVNLPPDYVRWLLGTDNLDPKLRRALENRKGGTV